MEARMSRSQKDALRTSTSAYAGALTSITRTNRRVARLELVNLLVDHVVDFWIEASWETLLGSELIDSCNLSRLAKIF